MQAGLVTVVVPIYKTEKYLNQCISSIVKQTYKDLEILLVDDGSPDDCPAICNEWARRDSRIRVIHKENEGLAMARNSGIENANGEYIYFIDSDDYISPETIEHSYVLAKKELADVVLFGFTDVNENGDIIRQRVPIPQKALYCGKEVQTEFLPDLVATDPRTGMVTNLWMSACMCLLSMEMIERANWRFVSEKEIISEDVYSLLALYKYVNKVAVLKESLYYVRSNPTSVTRSYRPDRFEKVKYFYERCVQLCRNCGYSEEVERRCAEPFVSFVIAALKQDAAFHKNPMDAVTYIRKTIDDGLLQQVVWEKRKDKAGAAKRILLWTVRNKHYWLCYLLLKTKNKSQRKT